MSAGRLDVLEQEAGGARAQGAEDVLVELEGRQHDHPGLGQAGSAMIRAVASSPSSARHPDVHQHHVGPRLERAASTASAPSAASPTTVDGGLGVEQRAEAGAHQRLVVDEQDADHGTAHAEGQGRHAPASRHRRGGRPRACRPARLSALAHPAQAVPGCRSARATAVRRRAVVDDLEHARGRVGARTRTRAVRRRRRGAARSSAPPARSGSRSRSTAAGSVRGGGSTSSVHVDARRRAGPRAGRRGRRALAPAGRPASPASLLAQQRRASRGGR